jgi:hypothetical protein
MTTNLKDRPLTEDEIRDAVKPTATACVDFVRYFATNENAYDWGVVGHHLFDFCNRTLCLTEQWVPLPKDREFNRIRREWERKY